MEEYQFWASLVSNIGVPAVICFYTLYGVKDTLEKLTDAIVALKENHHKEIAILKDELKELRYRITYWEARGHRPQEESRETA